MFIGPIVGAAIALKVQGRTISAAQTKDARDRAQARMERTYEQAFDYIYRLDRLAHSTYRTGNISKVVGPPEATREDEERQVRLSLRLFGTPNIQELFVRLGLADAGARTKSIVWVDALTTNKADPSSEHFAEVKASWDALDKALEELRGIVKDVETTMAKELGH